jgi:AraC-like DNA-binding protein
MKYFKVANLKSLETKYGMSINPLDVLKGSYISHDTLVTFYEGILFTNLTDETAIEVGLTFPFSAFYDYGMLVMSAASVKQALTDGLMFQSLNFSVSEFVSDQSDSKTVKVTLQFPHSDPDFSRLVKVIDLATTIRFICSVAPMMKSQLTVGIPVSKKDICASLPVPKEQLVLTEGAAYYAFPAECLEWPMPEASESSHFEALQRCLDEMEKRPNGSRLTERVEVYVEACLPDVPTLNDAAGAFNFPQTKLRRLLLAEQSTFSEIVINTRRRVAHQLLTTSSLPIKEVAKAVGYSSGGAFTTAVKNWFDLAPEEYRKRKSKSRVV